MISPINGHDRLATYDTAERVRGTTDFDGLERITSASPMDLLEIEQRDRKAGAYRRLARVMTELGWATVRVRDFTRGGYKEQVRGYVRSVPPRELREPTVKACQSQGKKVALKRGRLVELTLLPADDPKAPGARLWGLFAWEFPLTGPNYRGTLAYRKLGGAYGWRACPTAVSGNLGGGRGWLFRSYGAR